MKTLRSLAGWCGSILSGSILCGSMIGCTQVAASTTPPNVPPKHYIVVLDASASRTPDLLSRDQKFVRQIVLRLSFGDKLTLMNMQQEGLNISSEGKSVTMPVPDDPSSISAAEIGDLQGAQNAAAKVVEHFFQHAGPVKPLHTDIFATLDLVGEKVHDANNKPTTLVLLSDMLQSAQGVEMKNAVKMPPPYWVSQQVQMGTLPYLRNSCVLAVGANGTDRPGAIVYDFWRRYFTAAGTALRKGNYRFSPPEGDAPLCD